MNADAAAPALKCQAKLKKVSGLNAAHARCIANEHDVNYPGRDVPSNRSPENFSPTAGVLGFVKTAV